MVGDRVELEYHEGRSIAQQLKDGGPAPRITAALRLGNLRRVRDEFARMIECLPAGTIARLVVDLLVAQLTWCIDTAVEAGAEELTSAALLHEEPRCPS